MPYRRLPNTDRARLIALNISLNKGRELPPFKLAYSQGIYAKIQAFLPSYEHTLSEYHNSYNLQTEKNKDYQKYLRKARMYISHFIQVVYMAIQRGELSLSTLDYFGLQQDEKKLPTLQPDSELLECGRKLIAGEKTRLMEGLNGITNPNIAVLKVHFEKFLDVYNTQDSLKKRNQRAQDALREKRNIADDIIQNLWNEIENTFKNLPEELKREKASEYGVVYVFRKNEIGHPKFFESEKQIIS